MSRICLALKRAVPNLKMFGLCHQIGLLVPHHLSKIIEKEMKDVQVITGGLNHFAFLMGLKNLKTGDDLMPVFNSNCQKYFQSKWDRFHYAELTFEVYKRFGWFPYVGDNHICEYLQFGSHYTTAQDLTDWITRMELGKRRINFQLKRYYKKLKRGKYPKKGMLMGDPSGERAIPIIEAIIEDSNSYEIAVNIPNDGIIENLPNDLIIECSGIVNKEGIRGIKLGNIPKGIAALLRIESSIQELIVLQWMLIAVALRWLKRFFMKCLSYKENICLILNRRMILTQIFISL